MKKKLLVLLLALALVLAFSSLALAADNFSAKAAVESGKFVEQTAAEKAYTFYTDAGKVTLSVKLIFRLLKVRSKKLRFR